MENLNFSPEPLKGHKDRGQFHNGKRKREKNSTGLVESVLKTCEKLVDFPQGFLGKRWLLAFSTWVGYNSSAYGEEMCREGSFYLPQIF